MNPMTPQQLLQNLIEMASLTPEKKILLELPYSNDPEEHKSILITVSGNVTFYQLNERFYFDKDQICSEHYPITADHVLELIKAYDTAVSEFITDFFEGHPRPTPSPVMDHREYAHLEKKIQKYLDQAYVNTKLVFEREKDVSFLVYTFSNLGSIRDVLSIHRPKDPSQELKPITHLMPLINQLSQDAKS